MNNIKNIRQGLAEIRAIMRKDGEMSEDQFEILEELCFHENYGIRRQASGLLYKSSKVHRNIFSSGKFDPLESPCN